MLSRERKLHFSFGFTNHTTTFSYYLTVTSLKLEDITICQVTFDFFIFILGKPPLNCDILKTKVFTFTECFFILDPHTRQPQSD